MKFEQLLQIYWSRGFLYGGKSFTFDRNISIFFIELQGSSVYSQLKFIKRFELKPLLKDVNFSFIKLNLDERQIINMYLSQIISINNNIFELIKYNLIRLYLIKTFKGRCHALGKPVRGQRTRSNSKTSKICNKTIKWFIIQIKKKNVIDKKPETLNKKILDRRLKKSFKNKKPQIKMIFTKKQKNFWF